MSQIYQSDFSATQLTSNTKAFTANNTNVAVPIFGITGDVLVKRIWGVVTTVIGANHTKGHFQINDQTAVVDITDSATGSALSALPVGTKIVKTGLVAVAATVTSAAVGAVVEPAAAGGNIVSEFAVLKKATAATNIEYHYYTTDTPTSGAVQFFVEWVPRSANAAVAAL